MIDAAQEPPKGFIVCQCCRTVKSPQCFYRGPGGLPLPSACKKCFKKYGDTVNFENYELLAQAEAARQLPLNHRKAVLKKWNDRRTWERHLYGRPLTHAERQEIEPTTVAAMKRASAATSRIARETRKFGRELTSEERTLLREFMAKVRAEKGYSPHPGQQRAFLANKSRMKLA